MSVSNGVKFKIVSCIAYVVAPLSMLGSTLTMLTLYRSHRMDRHFRFATYHRILLGISVLDMVFSSAVGMGSSPVLPDEELLTYKLDLRNKGTVQTCSMQGFLLTFGSGSFVYNLCLMLYFLLVIRFGMRDAVIQSKIEPFMHVISGGFFLVVAVVGLVLEVFNPAGGFCWVARYPLMCEEDPQIPVCLRGDHAHNFLLWGLTVPLFTALILLISCLAVMAMTVWWRYRERQHVTFNNNLGYGGGVEEDVVYRRSRMVIAQSFLYGATLTNSLIWPAVGGSSLIVEKDIDFYEDHFWLFCLSMFLPLQGFFNFLIFIRPRYMLNRGINNQQSGRSPLPKWQALVEAVLYPVNNRSRHMRSTPPTELVSNSRGRESVSGGRESLNDEPRSIRYDDGAEDAPQDEEAYSGRSVESNHIRYFDDSDHDADTTTAAEEDAEDVTGPPTDPFHAPHSSAQVEAGTRFDLPSANSFGESVSGSVNEEDLSEAEFVSVRSNVSSSTSDDDDEYVSGRSNDRSDDEEMIIVFEERLT